jgi:predicted dehydrogenase
VIRDTVAELTLSTAGEETHRVWRPGYFNDLGRTFTNTFDRHVEDILTALRAGEQPPIHARCGRRALELAAASVRSFENGVRVMS